MRCPTLADLPSPPEGKTGWPWTIETPPLPEYMPDGKAWPRVSLVTPSYDQGRFLEETIRSVLLQGYPNLEYVVIDGDSNDHSVEIIKKYEKWLTYWISEKDRGQSHAINKGLEISTGQLLNWLNSDDTLLTGALRTIASLHAAVPEAGLIAGARLQRTLEGQIFFVQVSWLNSWREYQLGFPDFPQEATFFTRDLWDHVGSLDEGMRYAFDVVFFAQALKWAKKVVATHAPISCMLVHPQMKTLTHDQCKQNEYLKLRAELVRGSVVRLVIDRVRHSRLHGLLPILAAIFAPIPKQIVVVDYDVGELKWLPGTLQ